MGESRKEKTAMTPFGCDWFGRRGVESGFTSSARPLHFFVNIINLKTTEENVTNFLKQKLPHKKVRAYAVPIKSENYKAFKVSVETSEDTNIQQKM